MKENLNLLKSFGFTKDEIDTNPKVLLMKTDKLELRLKLAKIHGRTNRQFISKDYSASEETIYARTCALYLADKPSNTLVYGTSSQFEVVCGHPSSKLKEFFPLDGRGLRLLDGWYKSSIINQGEDESEQ